MTLSHCRRQALMCYIPIPSVWLKSWEVDCLCCQRQDRPELPSARLKEECKQLDGEVVPGAPVVLTVFAAAWGGNGLPVCSLRALLASRYYAGLHCQLWRMLLPCNFSERCSSREIPLAISFQEPEKGKQKDQTQSTYH